MRQQLPLAIQLRDTATFENFVPGINAEAHDWLLAHAGESDGRAVFVWGANGVGKTHLLQALCHAVHQSGQTAFYLPLEQADSFSPEVLEGVETFALVVLDNVDAVLGDERWERALFGFYNRAMEVGAQLVFSAQSAPAGLPCQLADLQSRLGWGWVFQLQGLDDDGKMQALQLRAAGRGIVLGDDVVQYLLRRIPRDMHALFDVLDKLDEASIVAQRKVTIPFVRELFCW